MRGTKVETRPGVWRLRVVTGYDPTTGNPRQASRTVHGSKQVAESELARFVAEIETGTGPVDRSMTVSAFLDRWLDHIEDRRSPTTVRGYREKMSRVRRDLGNLQVAQLTPELVDRAYQRWLDEGTSAATVHGIHRVLSAALRQAEKWGVVGRAATRLATPPSRGVHHPPTIDPAAVLDIISAARDTDPVLAAAVAVAATTGVRRGELCGLRWSDVDLAAGTLWVRRTVKYGVGRTPIEGPTKTHQVRRVALDRGTVDVLAEYRDRQRQRAGDAGVEVGADAYVFTLDPGGQDPWLPDSFSHSFERLARKVNAGVRLHDLRHFAATHAIAAGIDVRTVAGRLGHADASTTHRVYRQLIVERDRQAADVVGSLLSGT